MNTYKKHHSEHLDGTKGSWRPSLIASVFGADGHPIAWKEIVVVSCHSCGGQYGIGGDDVQITADGTTDNPVTCHHCKATDHIIFDKHAHAIGREHYAKLKADAEEEIKKARIRMLADKIHEDTVRNARKMAEEEAMKQIPHDAANPQELFKNAMKKFQP